MSSAAMTGARAARSPAVRSVAIAGLAARGVVYLLMGVLAINVALGGTKRQANQKGALAEVASNPAGDILLIVLAIGFAGYALWRLSQAVFNTSPAGSDAKTRLTCLIQAIAYGLLCSTAVSVLIGSGGSSQDKEQQSATARLMSHEGGRWLVGVAGLVVLGVGVYFVIQGVRRTFTDQLDMTRMSPRTRSIVVAIGAVGTTARGLVVGLVGVLVTAAAITADPNKSRGLDGALRTLAHQPFGPWLLGAVALGLIAFGVYGLAEAKWARL